MHSTAAAGLAIALNAPFDAPGQIVDCWIYKANEREGGYPMGHRKNMAMLFMVAIGCVRLRFYYQWRNLSMKSLGRKAMNMRGFSY
jgi:hypothetical protein